MDDVPSRDDETDPGHMRADIDVLAADLRLTRGRLDQVIADTAQLRTATADLIALMRAREEREERRAKRRDELLAGLCASHERLARAIGDALARLVPALFTWPGVAVVALLVSPIVLGTVAMVIAALPVGYSLAAELEGWGDVRLERNEAQDTGEEAPSGAGMIAPEPTP